MSLFIDLHQYQMIKDTNSDVRAAKGSTGQVNQQLRNLEHRIDKLSLINHAMWSFIKKQGDFSEQDLMDEVKRIDLLDGQEDGKETIKAKKCTKCNRMVHIRHQRCLYCGHVIEIDSLFETV